MSEYFARNVGALTPTQQSALEKSRALIVGCGGLGGYLVELLSRAGVGALTLCDGDVFSPTNMNRQLLCTAETMGKSKAAEAAARAESINPRISVRAVEGFVTAESFPDMAGDCAVVLDATDSLAARRMLAEGCAKAGLPMVHGAVDGWCAQIAVIAPGSGSLERIYPPFVKDGGPPPSVLSFTPALCASLQAAEAVKILCGIAPALTSRLLICDLRGFETTTVDV